MSRVSSFPFLQAGDTICICLDCDSRTVSVSRHASAEQTRDNWTDLKDPRQRLLLQQLIEISFNPQIASKAVASGVFLIFQEQTSI